MFSRNRSSMIFLSTFGASVLMLTACSNTTGNAKVNVGPNGAMEVTTSEGTMRTGSNSVPEDWPTDAPTYPGATVTYSASMNPATGKQGSAVVLTTTDTVDKVMEYYKGVMKDNGWTVTATMKSGDTSVMSATKDDRTFSLVTSSAEGQTSVTIGVEKTSQ